MTSGKKPAIFTLSWQMNFVGAKISALSDRKLRENEKGMEEEEYAEGDITQRGRSRGWKTAGEQSLRKVALEPGW